MTQDEKDYKGNSWWMKNKVPLLILGILIAAVLSISLYFPIPDNGETETHGMVCHEHEELTAQKSWLKLENVTSYEDIPENDNLSNDTRETENCLFSLVYCH